MILASQLCMESFVFSYLLGVSVAARTDYEIGVWFRYREKELAAVKINAGDVDIIANELEVVSSTLVKSLHENSLYSPKYLTSFPPM